MPNCVDCELIPTNPNLEFESTYWTQGLRFVAGLDEAGRGAWAGPVTAAVVVLPQDEQVSVLLAGVRDSKQVSPSARQMLAEKIKAFALGWGVGTADHCEIDGLGIIHATRLAMERAIAQLNNQPEHLLIDALLLPEVAIPQTALIKGDQRSLSIAAASILAKTSRDAWMIEAHTQFPDYGLDHHKGYGTKKHRASLLTSGISPIHRLSFKPISEINQNR
jgi:ribonuclease HII